MIVACTYVTPNLTPRRSHEDSKIDNNIIGNKSTFKNIAKQYRQKESQLPPYLIPKQQQLIAQHHNMNQENLWRHIMTQLINLYMYRPNH